MRHPEFMRRFIALLRKEVRQMLRDKSNLAVGLLLPIALILLFGYGLSFDVKNAPVAVVLEDILFHHPEIIGSKPEDAEYPPIHDKVEK